MPTRRRTALAAALAAAAFLALAGCAGQRAPARETPVQASPTIRPGVLAVTATDFMDTDGNRFRDVSTVVVYIFAESAQYQLPMRIDGAFDFILETAEGEPVRRWTFDPRQTADSRRDLAPGPGFVFELDLLKNGTDRVPFREAELVTVFTPVGGGPSLRTRTQSPLLIGSVGRSGGVR